MPAMQALVSKCIPIITCTMGDVPWYVLFHEEETENLLRTDHCDPKKVVLPENKFGFCFQRRPIVRFLIDGELHQLTGAAVERTRYYFVDAEIYTMDAFLKFAEADLSRHIFIQLTHELHFQNTRFWEGVVVIWTDREKGLWSHVRYDSDRVVALDKDRNPVTKITQNYTA